MRRLPYLVQGVAEAPLAFRAHPSVARDLVARLEALQSGAAVRGVKAVPNV